MSFIRYRNWLMENDTRESDVSYEEWLAGTYPNDTPLQRQHVVSAVVSGEMSRQGRPGTVMTDVVVNSEDDLRAALAAMARSRISRVADSMGFMDQVEKKLMTKINVEEASTDQLLSVARHLRSSIKDDMSYVLGAINSNQKSGLEGAQFNVNIGDNILIGDSPVKGRDVRDRVRSVVDGFLKVVAKNDIIIDSSPGSQPPATRPKDSSS